MTLGEPAAATDTEWRLIFKAGANFALTENAPTGYSIVWEETPTWEADGVYEISYGNVFIDNKIGVVWRKW